MPEPIAAAFAAFTHRLTEEHREWDSPHQFVIVSWDGSRLNPDVVAVISPGIHPDSYPLLMMDVAVRAEAERAAGSPPRAFALQIEGHAVKAPGLEVSRGERTQFNKDRVGRTFHQRPDAEEICTTWLADTRGRLYSATKRCRP